MTIDIPAWPHVYGSPACSGKIRSVPEDFIVHEHLAFEPSGNGEHVFLQIQKTGQNTDYVARLLARHVRVRQRDIGYAGLKDRHAVTTQWFSVWLPGKSEPDWTAIESESIKIVQSLRHERKLKRGALSGNRFQIRVRDLSGNKKTLEEQLWRIKANGIANYYGEQRFGRQGQNINKALAMFTGMKVGRDQRSLYLSAARSYLFNHILSQRVIDSTWNRALAGDTFMFDGSNSCFQAQQPDEEIVRRVVAKHIHPTGVLWGRGDLDVSGEARAVEQNVISSYPDLADGLCAAQVEKARRSLRVCAKNMQWQFSDTSQLQLNFTLPAGSYATALLRELVTAC